MIYIILAFTAMTSARILAIILQIAYYIIQIVAGCIVFKKAGVAPWKSIIPFYGDYTMFKFSWEIKYYWLLLCSSIIYSVTSTLVDPSYNYVTDPTAKMILTIVAIVFALVALFFQFFICRKLALAFGKSAGFGVGLFFLYPIFILILAFGKAQYVGKQ